MGVGYKNSILDDKQKYSLENFEKYYNMSLVKKRKSFETRKEIHVKNGLFSEELNVN
jgi:hypothetical protein